MRTVPPSPVPPCARGTGDLSTNRFNCGACGIECAAGEVCSGGICDISCGGGLTECSGICRDHAQRARSKAPTALQQTAEPSLEALF